MANSTRFPKGVAGVADHVHNLGLKLGLYNDIGSKSCAKYTALDGQWDVCHHIVSLCVLKELLPKLTQIGF